MIKICADPTAHPLTLTFQNTHVADTFTNNWKKANTVSIYKKNDKQFVSNNRPLPLLPICSKIFEKIFFMNSLSFLRRESCYMSITLVFALVILEFSSFLQIHMTFFLVLIVALLCKPTIFLDKSTLFDRVWHYGSLFKLKQNGKLARIS